MSRINTDGYHHHMKKVQNKIFRFQDKSLLEGIDIDKEYALILEKKSKLPSVVRNAIVWEKTMGTAQVVTEPAKTE